MREQRGQTGAELVGLLLVVALIGAALVSSGAAASVGSHSSAIVCRIAGGDCAAPPSRPAPPDAGAAQGPPLTPQTLPVLPWPGTSASVTCTFAPGGEPCSGPEGGGVGVQAQGRVAVDRGQTTLDDQGCPHQQLSITTTLELQASGAAEGSTAGGSLNAHLGHASKYQVTVSPDRADALADGAQPPNPIDPRTLGAGEAVQLSEEYYAGIGAEAQYRAIQARFGYDRGHRVSSAVQRISPTTVRVLAGDADFVRQTLALGLGNDDLGISLGGTEELADGKLAAIDIDVSTPEGWAAYQDFVASGRLPGPGTAGTVDPTTSQTLDYSDTSKAEVRLGKVTLGGVLGSSEGHVKITEHADGSVDVLRTARYNDVGIAIAETKDADDHGTGEPRYSLLLRGVDDSFVDGLQQLDGSTGDVPDGNLRLDLSASDLDAYHGLALREIAQQLRVDTDQDTLDEIGRQLADGDGRIELDGVQYGVPGDLAGLGRADTPREMLIGLYQMGGANATAEKLQSMLLEAGGGVPGEIVTPDCD